MISIGDIVLINGIVSFFLLLLYFLVKEYILSSLFNLSFMFRIFSYFFVPSVFLIVNLCTLSYFDNVHLKWIVGGILLYFLSFGLIYIVSIFKVNYIQKYFSNKIQDIIAEKLDELNIDSSSRKVVIVVRQIKNKIYCKIVIRLDIEQITDYLITKLNRDIESKVGELEKEFVLDILVLKGRWFVSPYVMYNIYKYFNWIWILLIIKYNKEGSS